MSPATRHLLGGAAALLVAAGLFFALSADDPIGGVLLRVGLLFGAAWLVAPLVRRPNLATIGLLAAGALVFIRPRLIVAVVVAAFIWRSIKRRQSGGVRP